MAALAGAPGGPAFAAGGAAGGAGPFRAMAYAAGVSATTFMKWLGDQSWSALATPQASTLTGLINLYQESQEQQYGLGGGAERASGAVNPQDSYKPGNENTGGGESLIDVDGDQINQAQKTRLDELQAQRPEGGGDKDDANGAVQPAATEPDQVEHIIPVREDRAVSSLASRKPSKVYAPDEANDMGLFKSSSEMLYQASALDIRIRNEAMAQAMHKPRSKRYYDGSRPPPKKSKVALSQQLPGSAAATFITRAENPITNDLEQIAVSNPEARRQLLDKGTFCTHYRALSQYPAAMRQFLEPYVGYQPNL